MGRPKTSWVNHRMVAENYRQLKRQMATGIMLLMLPGLLAAEIIWTGDFETGNFTQWHPTGDTRTPFFAGIPAYGRPPAPNPLTGSKPASYYGNGSLLQLVTSPVRQGRYAAKFTVKNARNGSEPADCDSAGTICKRRRTELRMHKTLADHYNGMPYMSERWMSVSHFVPSDWDSVNGSGYLIVMQVKPRNDSNSTGNVSPALAIQLENNSWLIKHRWDDKRDPVNADIPSEQGMEYSSTYPRSDSWPAGLVDFPDVSASKAALGNINKGGWTDWVIHAKFDARGSLSGGTGYLDIWKRAGSGPWVKVLHITPKVTTRGGVTFDHGICYYSPASTSDNGGFDVLSGFYMDKDQVWDIPANRVIYVDNMKVGGANAVFSDMSPDGSSPDSLETKPMPPTSVSVN